MSNNNASLFLKRILLCLIWFGVTSSSKAIATTEIKSTGGLTIIDPSNNAYWFTLGGRLHLDETQFSGNTYDKQSAFPSGANIRRAYLDFKGGVGEHWIYNLTLSFKDANTLFRGVYLTHTGVENSNIAFGQVGIPSGLENWGDYNDLMFLEPSLLTGAFFPEDDFGLGIYVDRTFLSLFTLAGALYQPKQNISNNYGDLGRSDRLGEALRVTFSPIHTDENVYHLGVWGRHQSLINTVAGAVLQPALSFQGFSAVPEAQARNTGTLVNTGPIRAKSYDLVGIEAAALWGPQMIQAEYLRANAHRILSESASITTSKSAHFYSWYVEGAYVLTGESRGYDFATGTFTRVKPNQSSGAWEMVARYSSINLVDQDIYGGIERNFSLGLNWYVTEQVRISTNYVRAAAHPTKVFSPTTELAKRQLNIVALRFQAAF